MTQFACDAVGTHSCGDNYTRVCNSVGFLSSSYPWWDGYCCACSKLLGRENRQLQIYCKSCALNFIRAATHGCLETYVHSQPSFLCSSIPGDAPQCWLLTGPARNIIWFVCLVYWLSTRPHPPVPPTAAFSSHCWIYSTRLTIKCSSLYSYCLLAILCYLGYFFFQKAASSYLNVHNLVIRIIAHVQIHISPRST